MTNICKVCGVYIGHGMGHVRLERHDGSRRHLYCSTECGRVMAREFKMDNTKVVVEEIEDAEDSDVIDSWIAMRMVRNCKP